MIYNETALTRMPAGVAESQVETTPASLRDLARPAISAALLWAGQELVPRLAELALSQLIWRIQTVERTPIALGSQRGAQAGPCWTGGRRRRRRHQNSKHRQ